jgi:hypothetical protein
VYAGVLERRPQTVQRDLSGANAPAEPQEQDENGASGAVRHVLTWHAAAVLNVDESTVRADRRAGNPAPDIGDRELSNGDGGNPARPQGGGVVANFRHTCWHFELRVANFRHLDGVGRCRPSGD